MKALLIAAEDQTITDVEVNTLDDIKALIGFDTLESDEIGPDGDRLYFDEECFLRGSSGRFQIDTVIPVSGKGVIIGSNGDTLRDAVSDIDSIQARIKYL